MADVITRFKLETSSFDSKLRDTAKALQGIAHQAQFAGKDFNDFSQKSIEAARALGTVASGATNTKDKLKDLVGSYNDAAKAYNSLSDAAKKGEFGQALSASLQKLQIDIKQTKEELYGLGNAVSGKGGGLFGENGLTGMMQVFGGNLLTKGVTMLTSELTGAIEESINLAKQGEGIRIAFDRLNQPGLLDKLKDATHGTVSEIELMQQAIKFDNFKLPLEDLANYLAFAQQKAKDTGESIDYLVNSIVTGLGRQSKQILDNLGISASELTRRMNEGADMTKAVSDIIKEEMAKAGDYIETAADRAARATADAQNQMEEFGRSAAPLAEAFTSMWNDIKNGALDVANTLLGPLANSILSIQNILNTTLDDRRIAMFEAFEKLSQQQQSQSGYKGMGSLQSVTAPGGYVEVTDKNTGAVIGGKHFDNLNDANTIKDWQKSLFKTTKPKTKSGKTEKTYEEGSIAAQAKLVSDLTKKWNDAGEDMRNGYLYQLIEAEKKLKEMKDEQAAIREMKELGTVSGVSAQSITEQMFPTKSIKDLQGLKIELKLPKDKTEASFTKEVGAMAGGISQMVGGIEALGIELPEGLKSAVEGISSLITIVSGIATIVTAIEALTAADTIIPFARGGIVPKFAGGGLIGKAAGGMLIPGNSFSGDNLRLPVDGGRGVIGVNSGELILSKAQQSTLASEIQNGGNRIQVIGRLSGEQLFLCAENWSKRTGKGEFVTW